MIEERIAIIKEEPNKKDSLWFLKLDFLTNEFEHIQALAQAVKTKFTKDEEGNNKLLSEEDRKNYVHAVKELVKEQISPKIVRLIKKVQKQNPLANLSDDEAHLIIRKKHIEYLSTLFPEEGIIKTFEICDISFKSAQKPVNNTYLYRNCYTRDQVGLANFRVHSLENGNNETLIQYYHHASPISREMPLLKARIEATAENFKQAVKDTASKTVAEVRLLSPAQKDGNKQAWETYLSAFLSEKDVMVFFYGLNIARILNTSDLIGKDLNDFQDWMNTSALNKLFEAIFKTFKIEDDVGLQALKTARRELNKKIKSLNLLDSDKNVKKKFLALLKAHDGIEKELLSNYQLKWDEIKEDLLNNEDESKKAIAEDFRTLLWLKEQPLLTNTHLNGQVQATLVRLLYKLGITPITGCDDAKDRDGVISIYVEANEIFKNIYHKYPDLSSSEDLHQLQEIQIELFFKSTPAKMAEIASWPLFAMGLENTWQTLSGHDHLPNTEKTSNASAFKHLYGETGYGKHSLDIKDIENRVVSNVAIFVRQEDGIYEIKPETVKQVVNEKRRNEIKEKLEEQNIKTIKDVSDQIIEQSIKNINRPFEEENKKLGGNLIKQKVETHQQDIEIEDADNLPTLGTTYYENELINYENRQLKEDYNPKEHPQKIEDKDAEKTDHSFEITMNGELVSGGGILQGRSYKFNEDKLLMPVIFDDHKNLSDYRIQQAQIGFVEKIEERVLAGDKEVSPVCGTTLTQVILKKGKDNRISINCAIVGDSDVIVNNGDKIFSGSKFHLTQELVKKNKVFTNYGIKEDDKILKIPNGPNIVNDIGCKGAKDIVHLFTHNPGIENIKLSEIKDTDFIVICSDGISEELEYKLKYDLYLSHLNHNVENNLNDIDLGILDEVNIENDQVLKEIFRKIAEYLFKDIPLSKDYTERFIENNTSEIALNSMRKGFKESKKNIVNFIKDTVSREIRGKVRYDYNFIELEEKAVEKYICNYVNEGILNGKTFDSISNELLQISEKNFLKQDNKCIEIISLHKLSQQLHENTVFVTGVCDGHGFEAHRKEEDDVDVKSPAAYIKKYGHEVFEKQLIKQQRYAEITNFVIEHNKDYTENQLESESALYLNALSAIENAPDEYFYEVVNFFIEKLQKLEKEKQRLNAVKENQRLRREEDEKFGIGWNFDEIEKDINDKVNAIDIAIQNIVSGLLLFKNNEDTISVKNLDEISDYLEQKNSIYKTKNIVKKELSLLKDDANFKIDVTNYLETGKNDILLSPMAEEIRKKGEKIIKTEHPNDIIKLENKITIKNEYPYYGKKVMVFDAKMSLEQKNKFMLNYAKETVFEGYFKSAEIVLSQINTDRNGLQENAQSDAYQQAQDKIQNIHTKYKPQFMETEPEKGQVIIRAFQKEILEVVSEFLAFNPIPEAKYKETAAKLLDKTIQELNRHTSPWSDPSITMVEYDENGNFINACYVVRNYVLTEDQKAFYKDKMPVQIFHSTEPSHGKMGLTPNFAQVTFGNKDVPENTAILRNGSLAPYSEKNYHIATAKAFLNMQQLAESSGYVFYNHLITPMFSDNQYIQFFASMLASFAVEDLIYTCTPVNRPRYLQKIDVINKHYFEGQRAFAFLSLYLRVFNIQLESEALNTINEAKAKIAEYVNNCIVYARLKNDLDFLKDRIAYLKLLDYVKFEEEINNYENKVSILETNLYTLEKELSDAYKNLLEVVKNVHAISLHVLTNLTAEANAQCGDLKQRDKLSRKEKIDLFKYRLLLASHELLEDTSITFNLIKPALFALLCYTTGIAFDSGCKSGNDREAAVFETILAIFKLHKAAPKNLEILLDAIIKNRNALSEAAKEVLNDIFLAVAQGQTGPVCAAITAHDNSGAPKTDGNMYVIAPKHIKKQKQFENLSPHKNQYAKLLEVKKLSFADAFYNQLKKDVVSLEAWEKFANFTFITEDDIAKKIEAFEIFVNAIPEEKLEKYNCFINLMREALVYKQENNQAPDRVDQLIETLEAYLAVKDDAEVGAFLSSLKAKINAASDKSAYTKTLAYYLSMQEYLKIKEIKRFPSVSVFTARYTKGNHKLHFDIAHCLTEVFDPNSNADYQVELMEKTIQVLNLMGRIYKQIENTIYDKKGQKEKFKQAFIQILTGFFSGDPKEIEDSFKKFCSFKFLKLSDNLKNMTLNEETVLYKIFSSLPKTIATSTNAEFIDILVELDRACLPQELVAVIRQKTIDDIAEAKDKIYSGINEHIDDLHKNSVLEMLALKRNSFKKLMEAEHKKFDDINVKIAKAKGSYKKIKKILENSKLFTLQKIKELECCKNDRETYVFNIFNLIDNKIAACEHKIAFKNYDKKIKLIESGQINEIIFTEEEEKLVSEKEKEIMLKLAEVFVLCIDHNSFVGYLLDEKRGITSPALNRLFDALIKTAEEKGSLGEAIAIICVMNDIPGWRLYPNSTGLLERGESRQEAIKQFVGYCVALINNNKLDEVIKIYNGFINSTLRKKLFKDKKYKDEWKKISNAVGQKKQEIITYINLLLSTYSSQLNELKECCRNILFAVRLFCVEDYKNCAMFLYDQINFDDFGNNINNLDSFVNTLSLIDIEMYLNYFDSAINHLRQKMNMAASVKEYQKEFNCLKSVLMFKNKLNDRFMFLNGIYSEEDKILLNAAVLYLNNAKNADEFSDALKDIFDIIPDINICNVIKKAIWHIVNCAEEDIDLEWSSVYRLLSEFGIDGTALDWVKTFRGAKKDSENNLSDLLKLINLAEVLGVESKAFVVNFCENPNDTKQINPKARQMCEMIFAGIDAKINALLDENNAEKDIDFIIKLISDALNPNTIIGNICARYDKSGFTGLAASMFYKSAKNILIEKQNALYEKLGISIANNNSEKTANSTSNSSSFDEIIENLDETKGKWISANPDVNKVKLNFSLGESREILFLQNNTNNLEENKLYDEKGNVVMEIKFN